MNPLSRALGGWLFHLYRCDICKKSMNIHEGLVLNPKDNTRVIHKGCRDDKNHNNKNTIRKNQGSF
jgi:hypothetical protein